MLHTKSALKWAALAYLAIIPLCWLLWWATQGRQTGWSMWVVSWPTWVTLAWGIALVFEWAQINKQDLQQE